MTSTLKQRFIYLRNREALAALVLPPLFVMDWLKSGGEIAWGLRIAGVVLLSGILLQGTLYWHLKMRSTEQRSALPGYFHRLFNGFKWVNAGLICAAVVAVLVSLGALTRADLIWCACLMGGALLEQINYFHYQLMYDTRNALGYLKRNKRLRRAALGLDLARARPA